jgi:hypothetical protein
VNSLGLQATNRHAVPPLVGRIELLNPGIGIPTAHGVGLGEEQTADELLGGPTVHMDKLPGQVIEQFRMGGAFSERAEVVDGTHKAASEEVVPDAIDPDAGHQRVGRVGQLARQFEAAAGIARLDGLGPTEDRRKTPRRQDAGFEGFAAHEHVLVDACSVHPSDRCP